MAITNDTIVAISTPPGRGGIGIVRLSGPEAKAIAQPLLRLRHPLEAARARFAEVIDPDSGAVLDEAVVTFFAAPSSYTSEDVVEIAAHGSPVLLDSLVRRCLSAGARLAEPGEFTQRAFLSGRLDLTQAEAVHGLIESTTLEQARTAAQQLGGGLSRRVQPVKQALIALIASLEAGIDFAEDDLELMPEAEIAAKVKEVETPLSELEGSFAYGRLLREGFRLAIVGRPNAGKSSLFNKLIRRDRAIVTAQPGTTRDPIAEQFEIEGIPVELIDTAGLRATTDEAESFGIAKSREAMAEADAVLLVIAANELTTNGALHEEDVAAAAGAAGRGLIVVVNKVDLVANGAAILPGSNPESRSKLEELQGARVVATSAIEGTGLEDLRNALLHVLRVGTAESDAAPITNLRQHQAVATALAAIKSARQGVREAMPHEMVLLDLHECLHALDELTGTTHTDEILNLIFASFCIGK